MRVKLFRGSSKWRDKNISILFQAKARSSEIQRFGFMAQITVWMREHKDIFTELWLSPQGVLCVNSDVINVMVVVVWDASLLCCYPLCVCATDQHMDLSIQVDKWKSKEKIIRKNYKKLLLLKIIRKYLLYSFIERKLSMRKAPLIYW